MVQVEAGDSEQEEFEILQASIPSGMGVIDTGCTTSVVGEQTADRYAEHFQQCGMPRPELVSLPPVQLKGFNGLRSSTRKGLKWTVRIGQLWGNITTYLVPGSAPFLLSRRVLEGMAARPREGDNQ